MSCNIPSQNCGFGTNFTSGKFDSQCLMVDSVIGGISEGGKQIDGITLKNCSDFKDPKVQILLSQNGPYNNRICPPGYTIDFNAPCKEDCSIPFFLSTTKGMRLKGGCVGNEPTPDKITQLQCCAGMIVDAEKKCSYGLCPNNDNCLNMMKNYCSSQSTFDVICQNYMQNSENDVNRKQVAQEWLKYQNLKSGATAVLRLCVSSPPGTCDNFLYGECAKYGRDDLNNENLAALCGCFLQPPEYNRFKNQIGGMLQSECDPLCTNPGSIQRGDNTCNYMPCTQNLCIVDFNSENIRKLIQDGIKVDQNCGGNNVGTNDCYIGINYNGANQLKEHKITINQKCGGKCMAVDTDDPNKSPVEVNCKDVLQSLPPTFFTKQKKIDWIFYFGIGGLIIALLLLFLIIFYIFKR